MNTLPPPTYEHSRHSYHRSPHHEHAIEALLTSAWHSIQSSPPPTLREILDAYRTKGDGDRDMLISMLNAKNAEDQRIAAVANLQRSMLDMYHSSSHSSSQMIPPLHPSIEGNHPNSLPPSPYMPSPPHTSYHHSPLPQVHAHPYDEAPEERHRSRRRSTSRTSLTSPVSPSKDCLTVPSSSSASRKRRRSSPSPSRDRRRIHPEPHPSHPHDLPLPLSPYSSSSSHSGSGSPRSRESMAIGALLSTAQGRMVAVEVGSVEAERRSPAPGRNARS